MLKLRRLVAAVALVLIIVGVLELRSASVDVLPEFLPATVDVQTEALGLSAQEVEQLITVTLEQDLVRGVAWLNTIQSESVPGLSTIHLTFDPGTNLLKARQLVTERVQSADLTNVSKPPQMLQPTSSTGRVMMIGLSSKSLSLIDLSVLARWTIVPRLTGVPGVANVATWGQRDEQLQVLVDPQRLQQNNVTLDTIITTTGNALWFSPLTFLEANTPGTGGFIETANQRLSVEHLLPITTPAELGQVALQQTGEQPTTGGAGAPLLLGDVATIVQDHQPLIGDNVFTNGPGLLLVINKLPGADVYQVTKGIEAAMKDLQPGLADTQVDYNVFRPATYIEAGISNLVLGLIIGAVLFLLALAVFFFDWRSVLVSIIPVAVGLAVAELLLRLFGFTLNWMTLAGLVIGLVTALDVAVSCVANIRRRLAEGEEAEGGRAAGATFVLRAARVMSADAVYVMVIVLVALLPIFSARGTASPLVRSLSLAFALTVVASTAAALLVTPALTLMLLSKSGAGRKEVPVVRRLERSYERALAYMIALPRRAYIPAVVIAVVAIVMLPFLGGSLVPPLKDTNVLVEFNALPGTSLTDMTRLVGRAGAEIKALPGVKDVGGQIGRAILGDRPVNVNSSELWLDIDGAKDYGKTLAAIRGVVDGYPGLDTDVVTYPNSQLAAATASPKGQLTVRLYGSDLDTLRSKAAEISGTIKDIRGIAATSIENLPEEPGLNIEVDLAAAQKYGIKPGDVRREATTLISSIVCGSLFEQDKVFDVVVVGAPAVRSNLNSIRDLLIDVPTGGTVKLSDVAKVTIGPSPSAILHDATSRKIDVTVAVSGRSESAVAGDIKDRLVQMSLPLEYHAEVVGNYGDVGATHTWLLVLGAVAVIGILLLLQSSLGSWRLALLVFLSSLVALSGGVAAAFFMSRTISPTVLVGLLAVFSMAVRSAVIFVHDCRDEERRGSEGADVSPDGTEAAGREQSPLSLAVQVAGKRVGQLLLIIVAAGLMLLPLAILGSEAGLEVVHAALVAVLASLVTLAFVSFFVVPALYLRFGHSWRRHDATT